MFLHEWHTFFVKKVTTGQHVLTNRNFGVDQFFGAAMISTANPPH